ncbi:enoyl-CoA hydratase [Rhodoplanes elegans]|uniref:enoyl-CoA hydratase n=1 Tax=Rhodoplanes elegans TaxID=29408 RepID=A0A327KL71_9BRAD|nr:enoyl-CoA hydratase [Rhodoplanes elegans]MBK5961629.1 enoyl-CoA hydratase [Rhodoplanes elegans]RAI36068.1 enoyl-CoA hydratase [Rhodoplanes elegans]
MTYETLIVETVGRVGVIRLNRPKALNALNSTLAEELRTAFAAFEKDEEIGCVVITGTERAFAAGADIKEMAPRSFIDNFSSNYMANWDSPARSRKPTIAAVAGFALGGGCELAMQCDLVIAADNAKFGQPEITLGIVPGLGGTQRLTRAVGKAKAMDLVLTGRMMDAEEAERCGLVSRVVPLADLMTVAMQAAETIAAMSLPTAMTAKELVQRAHELPLAEGLRFERRAFHALFGTDGQREGMQAFLEKRKPHFNQPHHKPPRDNITEAAE